MSVGVDEFEAELRAMYDGCAEAEGYISRTDVLALIARLRTAESGLQRERLDAVSTDGQCLEQHIWPGHAKYDAMVGIVRDLAVLESIQYSGGDDGYYECRFCEEGNSQYREFPIEHKIDCLHVRAREFTKANP